MPKTPAIMAVHLFDHEQGATRVGNLVRDGDGSVTFTVSEAYLSDPRRPILSLRWYDPDLDEGSRERLAARRDKIGLHGRVPPWFEGLLPEGALRDLVVAEMGPGDHDDFDVLTRLGADLPGAVLVTPETDVPSSAGPLELTTLKGFRATAPQGIIKFSLAGIQLKFTANPEGNRLTAPGAAKTGRCVIKVPNERFSDLPQAEFAAMELARMIGVDTAPCRLVSRGAIDGIPDELLAHGPEVLVVDRFDRTAGGARIHMEDAAQIVGAVGDRKYTMATSETVVNMIRRFSTDKRADILEAVRRLVADVLIGNGDNHLKNWSFLFPAAGRIRLSPAYDIVPTILFIPKDGLALRFVGTHDFARVNLHRFERIANFLRIDERLITREVRATVELAMELWPKAAPDLLGAKRAALIIDRLPRLQLVKEALEPA